MPYTTPIFGFTAPLEDELAYLMPGALQSMVTRLEAVLKDRAAVPGLADLNAVVAQLQNVQRPQVVPTAASRPTGVGEGWLVKESNTGRVVRWNGTRWVKVGGPPEVVANINNMGGSGQLPIGSNIAVRSIAVPAHTAGVLRCQAVGTWTADVGQAITTTLRMGGATELPASGQRTHNGKAGSVASSTPFHSEGYYNSDGTAFTLNLFTIVEANTPTFITEGSFRVWLEPVPFAS